MCNCVVCPTHSKVANDPFTSLIQIINIVNNISISNVCGYVVTKCLSEPTLRITLPLRYNGEMSTASYTL